MRILGKSHLDVDQLDVDADDDDVVSRLNINVNFYTLALSLGAGAEDDFAAFSMKFDDCFVTKHHQKKTV